MAYKSLKTFAAAILPKQFYDELLRLRLKFQENGFDTFSCLQHTMNFLTQIIIEETK
jgi:hypothetical protein